MAEEILQGVRQGDIKRVIILDKAKKKRIIVYVSTIILSIVYLFTAYKIAIGNGVFGDKEDVVSVRAKVLRITDEKETVSEEESGGKISIYSSRRKQPPARCAARPSTPFRRRICSTVCPSPRSRSATR